MATEQEQEPLRLQAIHLDLTEHSITFEADDHTATRLTFSPTGILYELLGETAILTQAAQKLRVWSLRTQQAESSGAGEQGSEVPTPERPPSPASSKEKTPTVVLSGRLQTKPQEGRADRHGKPTAWAQLLAHLEDREGATLLSTSFHGRTREIALQLSQGDHITAQGYLHLRGADDPEGRLSTFSVIHLVQYPGKPG